MSEETTTGQAGASCPGLSILRGCMGRDAKGRPVEPGHVYYLGHCGNCGVRQEAKERG